MSVMHWAFGWPRLGEPSRASKRRWLASRTTCPGTAASSASSSTFDTAWKALQSRARIEGIDCASPRQCLRAAFRLGLIDADPRWMQMAEDRNRTSQTYDEGTAREVFPALPGYLEVLKPLLQSLLSDLPT